MAISIGSAQFPTLSAQPFGYNETDPSRGITAKKWSVTGLLRPSEWLALVNQYDTWRAIRIRELDPAESLEKGTTVLLSGDGPGGSAWSVDCWFLSAPKGEQSGAYISASVELVDAFQSLEVLNSSLVDEDEPPVSPGTVQVGSGLDIATLKLLRPMETYGEGPSLELTAAGNYYSTGPLTVRKIRDIEGITDLTGWNNIIRWYERVIQEPPLVGTWFPITIPSATARNKLVNGIKVVEYTVSIQLAYIF